MVDVEWEPAQVVAVAEVGPEDLVAVAAAVRAAIVDGDGVQVDWLVRREMEAVAAAAAHFPLGMRLRRQGFLLVPLDVGGDPCHRGHGRAWLRDGVVGHAVDVEVGQLASDLLDCDVEVTAGCFLDDGSLELDLAGLADLEQLLVREAPVELVGGSLAVDRVVVTVAASHVAGFVAGVFDRVEQLDRLTEVLDLSPVGERCTWCGDPKVVSGFAPGEYFSSRGVEATAPARRACASHLGFLISWLQEQKDPTGPVE